MKKIFLLFGILFSLNVHSQEIKIKPTEIDGSVLVEENAGQKSTILTTNLTSTVNHNSIAEKWAVKVRPTFSRRHFTDEIDSIKQAKLKNKFSNTNEDSEESSRAVTPVIGTNFEGNWSLAGAPPDNSMAISNGGYIVTANNDGIEYYNSSGTQLYFNYWYDFFNDPSLTSMIYDPKVIYDSGSDRFVLVVLHGSTASTSKVIVCFSQTNNPSSGWYRYDLSGNPLANNCWFDYPALGVSNNEIYVTGNLFTSGSNTFNQSIIYQITKAGGYAGGSLNWQYWSGLSASPYTAFTLQPASYGHQGNYGPGIYFVSNSAGGSNQIRLWDLTNDIGSSPSLNSYTISTTAYSPAGDAQQLGSSDLMDNGDCRVQNAFYLDGTLHFVFHSDIGSGWNGINYNRINTTTLTNQSTTFGLSGTADYSYPSVVSFSTSITDKSVMIAFLRSSSSIYPELRVVNCDNTLTWSGSTLVKSGETFVNFLTGDERWGDYSGISRRHNAATARIWLAGCYGANIPGYMNNTYKTWISEIYSTSSGSAPTANFSATPLTGGAPLIVNFTDLSTNSPTSWSWTFTGGSPSTSTLQNPSVTYNTPGLYTVSLTSSNGFGSDIETKNNYINVYSTAGSESELLSGMNPKIFPNPVYDLINITFNTQTSEELTIKIVDMNGSLVKLLYRDTPKMGENILTFNKGVLPTGTYFVVFSTKSEIIKNEKIIVIN